MKISTPFVLMVSIAAMLPAIAPSHASPIARSSQVWAATADPTTTADAPATGLKKQTKNKRLQQMITQLGLTDDQIVKVKAILADQQSKIRKIKTDTSLSPDAKREQYTAVRKDSRKQLATVLDRDQLKKLREMRKNHDATKPDATPAAPVPATL